MPPPAGPRSLLTSAGPASATTRCFARESSPALPVGTSSTGSATGSCYRSAIALRSWWASSVTYIRQIGDSRYFDSQFSMQVKEGNIRVQAERGGGPEWDIGIYCLNAARYVFADEPTQVWATQTNSGDKRFATW